MKYPRLSLLILTGLSASVILEVGLRLGWGLGTPALSQPDSHTGYRFKPNQNLSRFGKQIAYNQYSQRSDELTLHKPAHHFRILMVGDSVLNGGSLVDQGQTITEQLKNRLAKPGRSAEVLNASAGLWAIGNRAGYLQKFGTFESDMVIIQIGTGDLTQETTPSTLLQQSLDFPEHPPASAIVELWTRYIEPRLYQLIQSHPPDTPAPAKPDLSNQAFQQNLALLQTTLQNLKTKKIPVAILFTPHEEDLLPLSKPPQYKLEFFRSLQSLNIPIFDIQEEWATLPAFTVKSFFVDGVHLTETGNQAIAALLAHKLEHLKQ
jgi:lysophospholipase L1-like esterase